MVSTFNGLEIAKRGLFTQQSALYTTGHNISNANTEGYTRQRVNFEQTAPFPPASRNRPEIPGQVGSGVQAGSVERVRESFLDIQFRNENKKTGYYESMSKALTKMEEIMNEPSDQGLSKTMDRFWQSLQDMSVNPEDAGARSVVRQRGVAVAETFNYLSTSIQGLRNDTKNEINVVSKEINSLANQINSLNKQIGEVEPHGMLPNDLYDERDRLVDQLSSLVDIKVTKEKSSSSSLDVAEGIYNIEVVGNDQKSLFVNNNGNSVALVDGENLTYNELQINYDGADQSAKTIKLGRGEVIEGEDSEEDFLSTVQASAFSSTGKLRGLVDAYGYDNGEIPKSGVVGVYPGMLEELDNMAFAFASEFNKVHEDGNSLSEIDSSPSDIPFFADRSKETQSALPKRADVVFVLDNSGSMNGSQDAIAAKLEEFAQSIQGEGVDNVRFGLTSYDGGSTTYALDGDNWSEDFSIIKEEIENLNATGGGTENLMGALSTVSGSYDFSQAGDGGGFKHVVFVTDEDADDEAALANLINNDLKPNGVKVHGVFNTEYTDVAELNQLVSETGGQKVNLRDSDWQSQLQIIGSSIGQTVVQSDDGAIERKGFASRIKVAQDILDSVSNIAASTTNGKGNGQNALDLSEVGNSSLNYDPEGGLSDFNSYYQGVIGEMAVDTQEANRMVNNTNILKQSVVEQRQSISAVSLDEEMTNMIKFQHAYNAAARNMTVVDEMIDRIINQMGRVGR
ncbi:flagellar hook-associated protein FlgK [Halobacillus salinus]|nr:flagellar hook-associated protein FlgK [Halobacillus salinus]